FREILIFSWIGRIGKTQSISASTMKSLAEMNADIPFHVEVFLKVFTGFPVKTRFHRIFYSQRSSGNEKRILKMFRNGYPFDNLHNFCILFRVYIGKGWFVDGHFAEPVLMLHEIRMIVSDRS